MDNSLLSCNINFELDWSKIGGDVAKKGMPISGHMVQICSVMAHILAK